MTMVEKIGQAPVLGIALCCERREVYTTYDERSVRVWNADDGRLLRTLEGIHRGNISGLMWIGQHRLLATCSLDHCMSVWNPKGESVARFKACSALFCCGFSTKHDLMLAGGNKKMFVMRLKVADLPCLMYHHSPSRYRAWLAAAKPSAATYTCMHALHSGTR